MKTMTMVIFLCLFSLFPLSTKAQNPVSPEIPQAVTEEEVAQFFDEYKARYTRMDLDAFMDLFSKEAVENRMLPYADIREAYRRMLDSSDCIQYALKISVIQVYEKSAFVSGRYELVQCPKGSKKQKVFRGNIQWNLIREDGLLKIKEINYGRDG